MHSSTVQLLNLTSHEDNFTGGYFDIVSKYFCLLDKTLNTVFCYGYSIISTLHSGLQINCFLLEMALVTRST